MGLERVVFDELMAAKETFRREVTLSSFGYPDLLVERSHLEKFGVKDFQERTDSESVGRWHNWKNPIYDTTKIFLQLGITADYLDVYSSRGEEKPVDLNTCGLLSNRDLFLDCGTMEHLANPGHAFRRLVDAVKVGGFVVHVNPVSQVNHGMYCFSPTLYHDMYTQNGFEIRALKLLKGPITNRVVENIHPTKRTVVEPECSLLAVSRKVSTVEFKWPTQSKYLTNSELRA